jgi:septal ring factor EnvC (AmiA/AmiB activator)
MRFIEHHGMVLGQDGCAAFVFEIRPQGRAVDPESWLRGTR